MSETRLFKRSGREMEDATARQIVQIRVDDIRPNRAQPRAEFDQNSIIRLADSIRRYGILQPLTVRRSDPEDIYGYELIAGERRLRAVKMLGFLTVPCVIMDVSEQTSAELAIIENLLREDLNMFEQAYGFKKLIENHELTQEEVARRMSLSQSAVANKLRLLRLTFEEQKLILEYGLSERHARALLKMEENTKRLDTIHKIAEEKMTVQETELYIESLLNHKEPSKNSDAEEESAKKKSKTASGSDREIRDLMQSLHKRVDEWSKSGRKASLQVAERNGYVELTVSLYR